MFLNQSFEHPFPIGAAQTLPDDAFRICVTFEAAIDIQHESHAAGHASTEVRYVAAKADRRPAGHTLSAILAAASAPHRPAPYSARAGLQIGYVPVRNTAAACV